MKTTNDTKILEAIQNLEQKVDALSNKLSVSNNGIDTEIIAVITAVAYNIFGRRIAVRKVQMLDTGPTGKKRFNIIKR